MNIDMIQRRLKIISDLQAEVNKVKEHYEESLNNDPVIQEAQKKEEEVKKEIEKNKAKIEKVKESPILKAMSDQMKELKEEMKNNKEALSQELADYYRDSGSMEIADEEGVVKRIKFTAKLTNN
jgi:paraquat-inducible protein B